MSLPICSFINITDRIKGYMYGVCSGVNIKEGLPPGHCFRGDNILRKLSKRLPQLRFAIFFK